MPAKLGAVEHSEAEAEVKRIVGQLTALRNAAGITPYRLAKLTGLSREAIRLIESGDRSPTLHSLLLISAALETPLGKVLQAAEKR